jgi:hypothetical protein
MEPILEGSFLIWLCCHQIVFAPSIGIIRTGTKGVSQPGKFAQYPR